MRGLLIHAGQVAFRGDLPEPHPRPGETRVDVLLTGICATDLALARGYMGFEGVPGHEFVGRAIEGPLAGQRVVGEINAGCGSCERCRSQDARHCTSRSVLGILDRAGAFAERLSLPDQNLIPVPDRIPDQVAVFAEPLAAALALEGIARESCERGSVALVVGDGKLGLLCAHVLAGWHPEGRVDLLGRHPERASWLGASARHLGHGLDQRPPTARYELVVEASGSPELLQRALAWVEPRGRLVLKTTAEKPVALDLAPLVVDEIRLIGSRCGRLGEALRWMSNHDFDPRPLVDSHWPLELGAEAFAEAARGGRLKLLVDPRADRHPVSPERP